MKPIIIAALSLLSASPALAADRFDLACSGTRTWSGTRSIYNSAGPITFRIRVDTLASQYCYDSCEATYPINTVGAKALILSDVAKPWTEMIDRTTGDYWFLQSGAPDAASLEIKAKCVAEKFSGFPDPPAKF